MEGHEASQPQSTNVLLTNQSEAHSLIKSVVLSISNFLFLGTINKL